MNGVPSAHTLRPFTLFSPLKGRKLRIMVLVTMKKVTIFVKITIFVMFFDKNMTFCHLYW